jgi:hypothetical protein
MARNLSQRFPRGMRGQCVEAFARSQLAQEKQAAVNYSVKIGGHPAKAAVKEFRPFAQCLSGKRNLCVVARDDAQAQIVPMPPF